MAFVPIKNTIEYTYGTYVNDDGELVEWQKDDVEYISNRLWSANWSEMGCFKTTTGLWWADKIAKRFQATSKIQPTFLFITSKSGKGTYFDAIPKSVHGYEVYNVETTKAQRITSIGPVTIREDITLENFRRYMISSRTKPCIVLAHYNCFLNKSKILPILKAVLWTGICADEAHRMKNRDTQWTRNIKTLRTIAGHKHAMTGTGFINSPDEAWSILNFIAPKEFKSYWNFRRYFCEEIEIGGYSRVIGIQEDKIDEFRRLRALCGPRRMMREVHKDIEEPIFTARDVDLNATQRKMYNEIRTLLYTLDQAGEPIHSPNVLSQLNRLRQICVATPEKIGEHYDAKLERRVQEIRLIEPSTKLDEVMDILDELEWNIEEKQQVVIFSNFKDPLELLKVRLAVKRAELEKDGLDSSAYAFIHMEEKDNDLVRYEKWHDMWPKKNHRIFMSTLQLGSESINLSSAQHVIFLDRSWSPKDNMQGVSRLFRPGQTGLTEVININAKQTVDQRIERANVVKVSWFKAIFDPDEEE